LELALNFSDQAFALTVNFILGVKQGTALGIALLLATSLRVLGGVIAWVATPPYVPLLRKMWPPAEVDLFIPRIEYYSNFQMGPPSVRR